MVQASFNYDSMDQNDRISQVFGRIAPLLLSVKGVFILILAGWAISSFFSESWLGMAYCWWGIGLVLFSIQIERPFLNRFPLAPLTVLQLAFGGKWTFGGMLLLFGGNASNVPIYSKYIANALPINASIGTLILIAGLFNYKIIRERNPFSNSKSSSAEGTYALPVFNSKAILIFTYMTGIMAALYLFIGVITGTLDRGEASLQWIGKIWKPDTVIAAFTRLRDIFYIISPSVVYRCRYNRPIAISLVFLAILPLASTFFLGSRGILLYPIFLLTLGLWLAGIRVKTFRIIICFQLVLSIIFVFAIGITRSDFGQTNQFNVIERVSIVNSKLRGISIDRESIAKLGRDIYASSDPHLFTEHGKSQRPIGFKGFKNLPYIYVPKFLMPNQPEVLDGHLIAKQIEGNSNGLTTDGRFTYFPSITFGGDLYHRFRWPGVFWGGAIFGLLYATFSRAWYLYSFKKGAFLSTIFGVFPATFLQGPPISSVSSTVWNWGYEMPKYALALIIIGYSIKKLINTLNAHGNHSSQK